MKLFIALLLFPFFAHSQGLECGNHGFDDRNHPHIVDTLCTLLYEAADNEESYIDEFDSLNERIEELEDALRVRERLLTAKLRLITVQKKQIKRLKRKK